MTTKKLLASNSYIQFPKFLGAHIGANEALILSAFCDIDSWCELNVENYDGWFYALQSDIHWETGLSEKQQRLAIQHLVDIDLLHVDRRGLPAKNYFLIDSDELENRLDIAYTEYKLHKSQMLQKVTSSDDEKSNQDVTKSEFLLLNKNKKDNNNQKSTGSGASSKNHSQVYKKRIALSDDLESGKNIDEQKKDKKKSPKDKFRDECLDIIEKECAYKLYSTEVHDLLIQYFEFVSAVPLEKYNVAKRVKTVSVWKKKLDRLAELAEDEGYSPSDIIKQSLDKKQYVFYPIQSTYTAKNSNNNKHEVMQDSVKTRTLEESKLAMQKKIEKGALLF